MKKIVTNLMLASSVLIAGNLMNSCDKAEELIEDVSVPVPFAVPVSLDAEIPFATLPTPGTYITYPEIALNLDLDKKIKEKYPKLSVSNLKSAKLDSFTIDYVSSNLNTKLDVIKNAKLYLKTPALEKKLIATVTNNTNATTLTFVPEPNVELIDYLKVNKNSIILDIESTHLSLDVLKIKINPSFKIAVGL